MKHVHKSWIVLLALHSFLVCLTFLHLPLSHLLLRSCSSSHSFSLLSHIVTSKALTTTWQLIWLSFLLIDKVRHAPGLFLLSRGWIYLWYGLSLYQLEISCLSNCFIFLMLFLLHLNHFNEVILLRVVQSFWSFFFVRRIFLWRLARVL